VVDRVAVRLKQERLGDVEAEDGDARLEVDDLPAAEGVARTGERVGEVEVYGRARDAAEDAARAGGRASDAVRVGEAEGAARAALARRRPRGQGAVGRAGGEVGLIEALVDVVGRRGVVEVVALVEGEGLKQVPAPRADVARLEEEVLRHFVLRAEVPLLDEGRLEVAVNGAELEGLGDVAEVGAGGRVAARVGGDAGVVADDISAAGAGGAHDAEGEPVA
jgi:hypothetical protein